MSVSLDAFPDSITYHDAAPHNVRGNWHWIVALFLQKLSEWLRNTFYLPLYTRQLSPIEVSAEAIAKEQVERLPFNIRVQECRVRIEGEKIQTFNLRVLELPLAEKRVRIVLFSFYGHTEGEDDKRWEPATIRELSRAPLNVLKALQAKDIRVDSLMTVSLGNVVLDGLRHEDPEQKLLPPNLIINRGLTFTRKTADQLFPFPLNYLLRGLTYVTEWGANPEQALVDFVQLSPTKPQVVIVETPYDHYFSGKGAFAPDFHTKLRDAGASVFRGSFCPSPFHARAHHALSLDHLVRNCETKVIVDEIGLETSSQVPISDALAREIFLKGDKDVHTCFLVCGSTTTPDIGTMLEADPLLSACQREAPLSFSLELVS